MTVQTLETRIDVSGIGQPIEILIDTWGIPHIFAATIEDVFFAQGFNAARDRLFQIDLWRRRGLGLAAEVLGPDYVERDRAARLFLYRGDMEREWEAYGPDARRIVTRFTDGINAYLDWLGDHPEAMPPEFEMLGYAPARWSPEDVVRIRSHGLVHNVMSEVARARTTYRAGWRADLIRQRLEPACQPHQADGIDLDLPDDVLAVYLLATQPLVLVEDPRKPLGQGRLRDEGSNNWAVAGRRTATGRPILANDPHRAYATPSLRYIAHLSAPGLDVIGAGEPALPGITAGHNGSVAFGFTIAPVDTEDLYVYELHPDDPTRYRYRDTWERMRIVRELVPVKGETPQEVELAFTRHGPVVCVEGKRQRAFAIRTTWLEPGTAPYLASLRYLRARNGREFRAALDGWRSPGENHVYADTYGEIGCQTAALVPRRVGWNGLLPVPGDGRYEWDGFYAPTDFPARIDPVEGFVATANDFNLPADFVARRNIGYEWSDPARIERIVQVLSTDSPHTLADSMRLQVDVASPSAQELIGLLRELRADGDSRLASAISMLTSWDTVESADSPAAALYEVWVSRHLAPMFVRSALPAGAGDTIVEVDKKALREAMRHPEAWWSRDPYARRDELLVTSLARAYEELESLLGSDPAGWRWGALHPNRQRHPLGFLDPSLDVGPLPVGGSSTTVAAAPYFATDLVQRLGASYRMVVDVGEWDNSVAITTPGQSGDPRSPHYRDLVERWQADEYVPLLYSRTAIERHTERRITLVPAEK
jgi:penicillin amidase